MESIYGLLKMECVYEQNGMMELCIIPIMTFHVLRNSDQTKAHYDEGMLRVDIPMNCEDMFKDVSPLNID